MHHALIIPCLRYRDAHAVIHWLRKAFDFEKHAVYANGESYDVWKADA